eukprot:8444881-Prorocentrum_lima.AAC.1
MGYVTPGHARVAMGYITPEITAGSHNYFYHGLHHSWDHCREPQLFLPRATPLLRSLPLCDA